MENKFGLNGENKISKLPQGKPKTCGFCSTPLVVIENDEFLAFTRYPPFGVICGKCIHILDTLRRLRNAYAIHYLKKSWDGHLWAIHKAMSREDAPVFTIRAMTEVALKLSKRSAEVFAGGASAPPRIALIGRFAALCGSLLEAANSVTGMPVEATQVFDIENGRARLMKKCNDDALMAPHGILFVTNGYRDCKHPGPTVYCCEDAQGLPPEVERVAVDGYVLDKING